MAGDNERVFGQGEQLALDGAQNLAAVAGMPIRRARRGLGSFYDKSLTPSAVITQFLHEIPILADLTQVELDNLTAALKYRRFGAGQTLIRRGEPEIGRAHV